jgi:hypothetical protein
MTDEACLKCRGCGLIANSKDREPWLDWTSLPLQSSLAVLLGIVRPVPCPECGPRPGDLVEYCGRKFVVESLQMPPDPLGLIVRGSDDPCLTTFIEWRSGVKILKRLEEIVAERLMG